jgi:hypothetical protein
VKAGKSTGTRFTSFLVDEDERRRHLAHLHQTLKVNGDATIATFAPDGPEKCSGLPVVRYSAKALAAEWGDGFNLIESRPHPHVTPSGAMQSFRYSRFQRIH